VSGTGKLYSVQSDARLSPNKRDWSLMESFGALGSFWYGGGRAYGPYKLSRGKMMRRGVEAALELS
jgi:hypothetical protein